MSRVRSPSPAPIPSFVLDPATTAAITARRWERRPPARGRAKMSAGRRRRDRHASMGPQIAVAAATRWRRGRASWPRHRRTSCDRPGSFAPDRRFRPLHQQGGLEPKCPPWQILRSRSRIVTVRAYGRRSADRRGAARSASPFLRCPPGMEAPTRTRIATASSGRCSRPAEVTNATPSRSENGVQEPCGNWRERWQSNCRRRLLPSCSHHHDQSTAARPSVAPQPSIGPFPERRG